MACKLRYKYGVAIPRQAVGYPVNYFGVLNCSLNPGKSDLYPLYGQTWLTMLIIKASGIRKFLYMAFIPLFFLSNTNLFAKDLFGSIDLGLSYSTKSAKVDSAIFSQTGSKSDLSAVWFELSLGYKFNQLSTLARFGGDYRYANDNIDNEIPINKTFSNIALIEKYDFLKKYSMKLSCIGGGQYTNFDVSMNKQTLFEYTKWDMMGGVSWVLLMGKTIDVKRGGKLISKAAIDMVYESSFSGNTMRRFQTSFRVYIEDGYLALTLRMIRINNIYSAKYLTIGGHFPAYVIY
jgi:hypothetical protein